MSDYIDAVCREILAAFDEDPGATPEDVAERLIALGLATPRDADRIKADDA